MPLAPARLLQRSRKARRGPGYLVMDFYRKVTYQHPNCYAFILLYPVQPLALLSPQPSNNVYYKDYYPLRAILPQLKTTLATYTTANTTTSYKSPTIPQFSSPLSGYNLNKSNGWMVTLTPWKVLAS